MENHENNTRTGSGEFTDSTRTFKWEVKYSNFYVHYQQLPWCIQNDTMECIFLDESGRKPPTINIIKPFDSLPCQLNIYPDTYRPPVEVGNYMKHIHFNAYLQDGLGEPLKWEVDIFYQYKDISNNNKYGVFFVFKDIQRKGSDQSCGTGGGYEF
ncbi:hypothetical protein [Agarilytica rhodophyticola]|uniref:hypothetical protein n=1 Tax=Agarilytica rhodophyticola TaxID=1737490 RepID=UPI000B349B9F|nr:hypothetical protein [Agarilytica rhodophyticola]